MDDKDNLDYTQPGAPGLNMEPIPRSFGGGDEKVPGRARQAAETMLPTS